MIEFLPFSSCAAVALALVAAPGHAAVDVCHDPDDRSFVAIGFMNHERSSLDGRSAATDALNQNLDALVTSDSGTLSAGFGHRYTIFNFEGIEPQTNAHLHTSFASLHWQVPGRRAVRASVALAVSASSNILSRPAEYEREEMQLLVAVVSAMPLSTTTTFRYGICGDRRFGDYRVYPAAAMRWQTGDWEIELGFPSSSVSFGAAERWSSTLQIAPDGNEWHVADESLTAESRFVYKSIALEWVTRWQILPRLDLSVSVGRQLRSRYELTLEDGTRVHLSGEPATRLGAGVRWRF